MSRKTNPEKKARKVAARKQRDSQELAAALRPWKPRTLDEFDCVDLRKKGTL